MIPKRTTSLRMAARKFRLPLDVYADQTAKGNRWCKYHKAFHDEKEFYRSKRAALYKKAMTEIKRK